MTRTMWPPQRADEGRLGAPGQDRAALPSQSAGPRNSRRRALLAGTSSQAIKTALLLAVSLLSVVAPPALGQFTIGGTVTSTQTLGSGVGSITPSGAIQGGRFGLDVTGSGVTLTNSGIITGSSAVFNTGSIGTLTNSGTIVGAGQVIAVGIFNAERIGTLVNSGTITAANTALYNGPYYPVTTMVSQGTIGMIVNSGVIAGNISSPNQSLTISGGGGSTTGTLTGYQGAIGSITTQNLTLASGNILLNDHVSVTGSVSNSANLQVNNQLTVTGNYSQSTLGTLAIGVTSATNYGELLVSGGATLTGDKFSLAPLAGGALTTGTYYTLVSAGGGLIGSISGISVTAPAAYAVLTTIIGNNLEAELIPYWPVTTSISTTGTLSSGVGSISSTGTISGVRTGITVSGNATALTNSGLISVTRAAVRVGSGVNLGTLTNNGMMNGGVGVNGTVGTLVNTGAMLSTGSDGVEIDGTTSILSNSGTIAGYGDYGLVAVAGTLGQLSNSGTITSTVFGLYNLGTIQTLVNQAGGTISASLYDALVNSGTILGTIANSGVFAGNIISTPQALTIAGGGIGTVGTLTGYGGAIGTISSPGLTFASGNLLLNDHVSVGSANTFSNSANLLVNNPITVTGNYVQGTSGTLGIGVTSATSYGELVVNGTATLTGDSFAIGTVTGGTLAAGTYTLVSANTLVGAASGMIVSVPTGFVETTTIVGNTLEAVVTAAAVSYWPVTAPTTIAGTLSSGTGSIGSGGTISGAHTAVTVAGSGTTLINNGLINGAENGVLVGSGVSLASLNNGGTITSPGDFALQNLNGTIGTLTNQSGGLISGTYYAIVNDAHGSIGTLDNSGTIAAGPARWALNNAGTLATLTNRSGGVMTSGTGGGAIYNTGTILGAISNSGTIAGRVVSTAQALTIAGGGIGTIGTLTGNGGSIGTISAPDVTFASGNLLLNDHVSVGSTHTFSNSANVQVNNLLTVTGNYSQSAQGTLAIGVTSASTYGELTVTGTANLTGDQFSIGTVAGGTLAAGTYTLVSAGTLIGAVSGMSFAVPPGFTETMTIVGNALEAVVAAAPYWPVTGPTTVAGTLSSGIGSISSGGTILAVNTAVLVAGNGTSLINSGLIAPSTVTGGTLNAVLVSSGASGVVLLNAGTIYDAISNQGGVSTLHNESGGLIVVQGTVISTAQNIDQSYAVLNQGSIGALVNDGAIVNSETGTIAWNNALVNNGTIISLDNTGTIASNQSAIRNTGVIGTLSNSGTILSELDNQGFLGTLSVASGGLLSGGLFSTSLSYVQGPALANGGTIAELDNAGTISGGLAITNTGTITRIDNSGSILSADSIAISNSAIALSHRTGVIGTLSNSGVISGGESGLYNGSSMASLINQSGGTITGGGGNFYGGSNTGAVVNYGSIGVVVNSGVMSETGTVQGGVGTIVSAGLLNEQNGTIASLINSAGGTILGSGSTVSGAMGITAIAGLYNGGVIGTLTNAGTIAGHVTGLYNNAITFLGNSGVILGGSNGQAVYNSWSISTFENSGSLIANQGLANHGFIDSLVNDAGGLINGTSQGGIGIGNYLHMGNLTNGGTISGTDIGLYNDYYVVISTLVNNGTISGGRAGIYNFGGNIVNLQNNDGATILSSNPTNAAAVNNNAGTIGTLTNAGIIAGRAAILNAATIATLTNSGTIAASGTAISNSGTILGTIINSGLIAGTILSSSQDLTIAGGSGTTFGTLTGYQSSIGSIAASGLTLASGNLLLNDHVSIGSSGAGGAAGTFSNSANVQVNNALEVTGNYTQTTLATLGIGVSSATNYGELVVTGTANLTGGSFSIGTVAGGTLAAGTYTLVSATGGITGTVGSGGIGVTVPYGFGETASIVAGDFLEVSLTGSAYWPVSGATTVYGLLSSGVGSISSSGVISAVPIGVSVTGSGTTLVNNGVVNAANTGVKVAGSVSLSTLSNSGTISGASGIVNALSATIGALNNSGTISGSGLAVYNYYDNYHGVSGVLGAITNSGVIAGNISSQGQDLTISGGSGTLGTLTGYPSGGAASVGLVTAPNVTFASGNLLLNDDINAYFMTYLSPAIVLGTVTNNATLQINNHINVSGNYSQSTLGTLAIGVTSATNYGELLVTGSATLTGDHFTLGTVSGSTFAAGTYTLVSAGTLIGAAAGMSVVVPTGFTESTTIVGNLLEAVVTAVTNNGGGPAGGGGLTFTNIGNTLTGNVTQPVTLTASGGTIGTDGTISNVAVGVPVIGNSSGLTNLGTIAASGTGVRTAPGVTLTSIANSGTISGSVYAINNNGGSIGALSNSGLIAGNIVLGGQDLTIGGGGGTLTGSGSVAQGTITATNVTFTGAQQVLNDQITVAGASGGGCGGMVTNNAALRLNSHVSICGQYNQSTSGALVIGVSGGGASARAASAPLSSQAESASVASGTTYGELLVSGTATLTGDHFTITPVNGTLASGTYTLLSASSIVGNASSMSVSLPTGYVGALTIVGDTLDVVVTPAAVTPPTAYWPVTAPTSVTGTLASGTGTISAAGTISGVPMGVLVTGTGTSLFNAGLVSASGAAVAVASGAGTSVLSNSGTITGATGVANSGTIGALTNSGTLSGSHYALYNSGSMGALNNSGVVAGDVVSTAQDLTIAGASGAGAGTLTGFGGAIGRISAPNVTFASGNLVLNDHVNAAGGTVINDANLAVNAKLSITGTYVQSGAANLVLGVTSSSVYGELVVSGAAKLSNDHITLVALDGATFAVGEKFTIVSASSVTDDGLTVSLASGGYRDRINLIGGDLVVTLMPDWTAVGKAAGGAAVPVGPVLDQLESVTAFQPMLDHLGTLPQAAQYHALKQLGVAQLTPKLLSDGGPGLAGDAIDRHQSADRGEQAAVWGQMLGGRATRDTTDSADGYHASSYGLMAGLDLRQTGGVTAGLALGWQQSFAQGTADSAAQSVNFEHYLVSAYGGWRETDSPFFAQWQVTGGYNQFHQTRGIDFLRASASADYGGWQFGAKLAAGYDIPLGAGATLTPLAGFNASRFANDSYTEKGAGLVDLSVSGQSANSLDGELGAKIAVTFGGEWGRAILDLSPAWTHSLTDGAIALPGAMGGVDFVNRAGRAGADGARLKGGITLEQSGSLSLRVEYDGDLRSDYRGNAGFIRLWSTF